MFPLLIPPLVGECGYGILVFVTHPCRAQDLVTMHQSWTTFPQSENKAVMQHPWEAWGLGFSLCPANMEISCHPQDVLSLLESFAFYWLWSWIFSH